MRSLPLMAFGGHQQQQNRPAPPDSVRTRARHRGRRKIVITNWFIKKQTNPRNMKKYLPRRGALGRQCPLSHSSPCAGLNCTHISSFVAGRTAACRQNFFSSLSACTISLGSIRIFVGWASNEFFVPCVNTLTGDQ